MAAIAPNRTPRGFVDLGAGPRMRAGGLALDFAWAAEVIASFPDIIGNFLEHEAAYEAAWLAADFAAAGEVLDRLEAEHGLSLWLIGRRIAVLRTEGAIQPADYVSMLIAEGSAGTLNGWLAYMMGYRADPNVSPAAYVRRVDDTIAGSQLPEPAQAQLRYYALASPLQGHEVNAVLLSACENLPIIDRYVAFLDIAQALVCDRQMVPGARNEVARVVRRLSDAILDDRLTLLDEVLDPGDASRLVARLEHDTADLYTRGAYAPALERIAAELALDPSRTNLYGLAARASLRSDDVLQFPSPIGELVRQMASVHVFADDDATTTMELMREALVGSHRSLAASIRSLFGSRSTDPSDTHVDAAIEALNSSRLTPLQLRTLPVADPVVLLDAAIAARPSSLSLRLQRAVLDFGEAELDPMLSEQLPLDRRALYTARALTRLGRHDDAIAMLRPLLDNKADAVANDARRELFLAYQAAGRLKEALRLVADAHRRNPKLHALFRLASLLDEIEQGAMKPPFEEIALSIAYHVANRFGGDARAGAEADAAEEYALSLGAPLPSRINPQETDVDGELFDIYLDQVCSPAVLDKFMAIENAGQVEIERLEICRILSERDPIGRQRYLDEIQEITRRRVVRERFEQVERTKIYVDTDGVKRQAEKTLRDTYTRFAVALADEGEASERVLMMRKVQQILSEIDADGVRIHFPDLPASERELMFERLVRDFMRMLISSQEYGLEAYLSTRVRHGTMGNQLRSAFELNSLITQRDGGVYQPDRFWPEALNLGYNPLAGWLSDRLARFSEAIDAAIEDLVRRRVQVRSDIYPNGLFVFQSFNYDIIQLQSEIAPDTSFDAFLDKVIDQFWLVLELSLSAVRAYIEEDFLQLVHAIIDDLERDVVQELNAINSSPLRSAIAAARTQTSVIVANVANWFTLARDMERPDYEFGVAVEVATESIRVCHPSLDVQLTRRDHVTFECRGRSLESLVYLLFTAMDNAVAHSGFVDVAPDIALETVLADGWLEMMLINSCMPVGDFERANERLTALRARLDAEESRQNLAVTEGGSGYAKIIRILRHDLLTRFVLEFGYRSESEYFVKIGVEAKAIVK
jgi:tetratricopeptide (TPR) repeat protein